MAYQAPFVDYQPHPSGNGYLLQHQNGNVYYSYGPGADMIKAQIDASRPPDQRLAMNAADASASFDAGAGASVPDVGPAPVMSRPAPPPPPPPGPAMSEAPPPEPNASVAPNMSAAPPQAAPPPAHVNEPPGKVVPPSGELPMMKGATPRGEAAPHPQVQQVFIDPYRHVAGRNPAAEARNAVAVPTAQSMVTEGGIQDPEARKAAIEAHNAQIDAEKNLAKVQEDSATAQLEQQRADVLEAQQRQGQAEQEIARQAARQTVLRQEFDNRMAIAQKDYDTSTKKEVDQYRIFRGDPGGQIMALLSVAMGGFAAGATGQRNMALDQLNRRMDNDIEIQREQIQKGLAKSSNDMKRISDQYNLDYDDAGQILKMNYARRLDAEAQKKAAMAGTLQAQQAYAAVAPQLQKYIADAQANLQASLNGKVKLVQEARMVSPTRGGDIPKTPEQIDKEYTDALERQAKRSVSVSTIEHGGQKPGAQAPEKTPGEIIPNLARAAVVTDAAIKSIDDLIAKNEKRGYVGAALGKAENLVTDTQWKADVNHSSQYIASAEAKGLAPDKARTAELEDKLLSGNYNTVKNHLLSLREQLSTQHAAIRDISSKTAKVGTVGAPAEGVAEE